MRTLVHLSDIHFGAVDYDAVRPLIDFVRGARPDLVAVSGDLTQRARPLEFRLARSFLDSLPGPRIVVPGNHDVPLYNLYNRFARPLDGYRRYIDADTEPSYSDSEIAVIGLNTARSFVFKGGRINVLQVERIRRWLCPFDEDVTKIVVTHHPFDLPPGTNERLLVGRARMAMKRLAGCGADVFLSGHLHLAHLSLTSERYQIAGVPALIVQAGTATSTRGRGQTNSFNVLRISPFEIEVEAVLWDSATRRFAASPVRRFRRTGSGWQSA